MSTQEDAALQLQNLATEQAAALAAIKEGLAELSPLPGQIATQAASIASLQAEIANTGTVSPTLQAALDAVMAAQVPINNAATQIANIVPGTPTPV